MLLGILYCFMKSLFNLQSEYSPAGDQPLAIEKLVKGFLGGEKRQTLLGVTGSGKTFTMANVIRDLNRPTLVVAHNKTLAAQLCAELRKFFPENAVEYFVSYYDYYQPEAYIPRSDTFIEKEAQINDEIDRLRHATTQSLLTRDDVIVVSSVSCIYSVGSPEEYKAQMMHFSVSGEKGREDLMHGLISIAFERTSSDLVRGTFRVRGEIMEIMPVNLETIYRVEFSDGVVKSIAELDFVTRRHVRFLEDVWIFPAKHYITAPSVRERAMKGIRAEMNARVKVLEKEGKMLEAERVRRRTVYDLSMIKQTGFCSGIENYSRWFDGRKPGEPPFTLLDFFPDDYLMIIDESHVTVPQVRGMLAGDQARKKNLINFGFRLPSAVDNRPLSFDEFYAGQDKVLYTSATPAAFELEDSGSVVEQIIRPTGLVDPEVLIRPVTGSEDELGQIDDLIPRIKERISFCERTMVTTLTKKMAEDLTDYLKDEGVAVAYIHSDVQTLDRVRILTEFRKGEFDVLVGVNLLREGLDLPEVSLVAILDADKEGFLRSEVSLIQTMGRAARNVRGLVVLYADKMTGSLERAIAETKRRRDIQLAYNKKHGIVPVSVKSVIDEDDSVVSRVRDKEDIRDVLKVELTATSEEIREVIRRKTYEMKEAAKDLDFETARVLRDEIEVLKGEAED